VAPLLEKIFLTPMVCTNYKKHKNLSFYLYLSHHTYYMTKSLASKID